MPIALAHLKMPGGCFSCWGLLLWKKSLFYNPMNIFDSLKRIIFIYFLQFFYFKESPDLYGTPIVCVQRIDDIGRDIDEGEYPRDGLFLFWKIIKYDKTMPLNYLQTTFFKYINLLFK